MAADLKNDTNKDTRLAVRDLEECLQAFLHTYSFLQSTFRKALHMEELNVRQSHIGNLGVEALALNLATGVASMALKKRKRRESVGVRSSKFTRSLCFPNVTLDQPDKRKANDGVLYTRDDCLHGF